MAERIGPALRPPTTAKRQAQAQVAQMAAAVKLQVREAYLNLTTAQQRVEVLTPGAVGSRGEPAHHPESL